MRLNIFSIILILTVVCDSARILVVIPTPSISHQVVYRPVTLELAKRGHEVVVITTDPIFPKGKAPVNYTEIDVHDISYEMWKQVVDTASKKANLLEQVKVTIQQIEVIFIEQLQTVEVQKLINDEKNKFDLLLIESWVTSTLAFTHIFKVPTIQVSTFGPLLGIYEAIGAPTHHQLYPLPIRQKFVNLSIWEKISEYYSNYLTERIIYENVKEQDQNLKKIFGPDLPSINDLRMNIDMTFLNVYPIWDSNRPVPPNVIYLGGLHQSTPKLLPEELKSYLDSSNNGVIYMSLGTNVKPSMIRQDKINIFLKVFSNLPYNVLWKWDTDDLEGRPNNVNISKWFPQSDLLRHPNVKLFITQGGLQSTDESITAGVPLIGIPMLGDQWYNAEMYVQHKIGAKLDIHTLTDEKLTQAINTVLTDNSYRTNIAKLNKILKDQPQTSLERAVWWTEYVLRHGGARHLRSPAANIGWIEYLELELVAVILIVLIALSTFFVYFINFLRRVLLPYTKLKIN